jgi:hypothetical protein
MAKTQFLLSGSRRLETTLTACGREQRRKRTTEAEKERVAARYVEASTRVAGRD